jgi:hypothetical protein
MPTHPFSRHFTLSLAFLALILFPTPETKADSAALPANAKETSSTSPASRVVRPADTGAALVNPGMGWTMMYYSNILTNYGSKLEPSDTLEDFPGLSVIYLRLPWAFLEPEEGRYDWSLLDTPTQRWGDHDKQIALRISCCESWMRYATPQWVEQAGAKGYNFTPGQEKADGPYWEPDYNDPVFLAKLEAFLKALAARYDGNPAVAFVDVGSYGVWGEGHTWASTHRPYDDATRQRHLDLYAKYFKKTLLSMNDDFVGPEVKDPNHPLAAHARSLGTTLRDDSICVQPAPNSWFHAGLAQAFWPQVPVILEHEHYGPSKEKGAWGDGSQLAKAVEEYHASYLSIHWWPREFLEANRAVIDRINRRLGYRLQLREARWEPSVALGQPFVFQTQWANAGVASCYPGGFVAVTLKDAKGGIAAVCVDPGFDLRQLEVGPEGQAPVKTIEFHPTVARMTDRFAANTQPGVYDLFVSVGTPDGTPRIALPLPDEDGHRRYRLGQIELKPRGQ